jgi:hypothetical protein
MKKVTVKPVMKYRGVLIIVASQKNVIYNRPSNKFIFRATYENLIVYNINKMRLENIFSFCSAFSLFFLHGI